MLQRPRSCTGTNPALLPLTLDMKSALAILMTLAGSLNACELCAIYTASSARGESGSGFLVTVSQQYVPHRVLQFEGEPYEFDSLLEDAYLRNFVTHIVPAWNFSSRLGVSLSVPVIHREFRRVEVSSLDGIIDESGSTSGLGDVALIGRFAPIQVSAMDYSVQLNLLAGVKFPTGKTDRLEDEVERAERDLAFFGPNHPHSATGGIHQHDLTLGSGSHDGVFGTALSARWKRFFFGQQLQYYLRTEAEGYRFGDLFIASGGPGAYLALHDAFTISLQGNVYYESMDEDELIEQQNDHTGFSSWYAGPQLNFTVGEHVSINAAIDIPITIDNNGLQTVPDYRLHGGLTWRF